MVYMVDQTDQDHALAIARAYKEDQMSLDPDAATSWCEQASLLVCSSLAYIHYGGIHLNMAIAVVDGVEPLVHISVRLVRVERVVYACRFN